MFYTISVGGSKIVPDEINVKFLKDLRKVIQKHIRRGHRFGLVSGGGRTCRKYQGAAKKIIRKQSEIDWVGIESTKLNAKLLQAVFNDVAHKRIVSDYSKKEPFREKVLIGSGWKPGWSTDYDAVVLARWYDGKFVINLTDVDYIYDKDPKKHKNAEPLKEVSWKRYKKIIGGKWTPGLHTPFDPIASRAAERFKMKAVIINRLSDLDKFLSGKNFRGTVIS